MPPGVPLRVWDWPLIPLFFVVPVVVFTWVPTVPALKPYALATASIVVAVAFAQWFFGFRAYTRWDDFDVRWLRRSQFAGIAAFALFAVPFLLGMMSAWLFATAAYFIAADPGPAIGRVRSALTGRAWLRLKVVAALVGVVGIVGHALASLFGFGVPAWILGFVGAIVFGFALRAQPPGNEPLLPRVHRRR